ncbi:MAG: ATP-grasp domain-containing protein [Fuerstiella sp.]
MPTQHVLVIEYLHADSHAFREASPSMKREGQAMLRALLADLGRCRNVHRACGLCSAALGELASADAADPLKPTDELLLMDWGSPIGPDDVLARIRSVAQSVDAVLLVAPECDGLLVQLVSQLRDGGVRIISPDTHIVRLGSDKWATYEWCRKSGVPTVPTSLNDVATRFAKYHDRLVTKPRDGAGSEGILRVTGTPHVRDASESSAIPAKPAEIESNEILQPWIPGRSFSIAAIGRGSRQPATILPIARQDVVWHNDRVFYHGGTIQPDIDPVISTTATRLAKQIAGQLMLTDGYLGIDLLQPEETQELLVVELNPRVCSGFVGYHQSASGSILNMLLNPSDAAEPEWCNTSVHFRFDD